MGPTLEILQSFQINRINPSGGEEEEEEPEFSEDFVSN